MRILATRAAVSSPAARAVRPTPAAAVPSRGPASGDAARGCAELVERADRFGHRFEPSQAPGLDAPAAPGGPIQRLIDPKKVWNRYDANAATPEEKRHRKALLAAIKRFNAHDPERTDRNATHSRFRALDDVEHLTYQWFNARAGHEDDPNRTGMFELLNQVQQHHRGLVRHTVDRGYDLWLHDRDQLTREERVKAQAVWQAYTRGGNGVSMSPQVQSNYGSRPVPARDRERLEDETFSDVARLMSRPRGRQLLTGIHDRAATHAVTFQMRNTPQLLGEGLPPVPVTSPSARALNEPAASVRRLPADSKRKRAEELAAGPGSAVQVNLVPGLRDADFSDFDAAERRVPSPTFVGLGHELVHAAHFQSGTYALGSGGRSLASPGIGAKYKGDIEEFATIASQGERDAVRNRAITGTFLGSAGGTSTANAHLRNLFRLNRDIPNEADIRHEHGIGLRSGHITTPTPEVHPGVNPDPARAARASQEAGRFITEPARRARAMEGRIRKSLPPPAPRAAAPAAQEPWYKRLFDAWWASTG